METKIMTTQVTNIADLQIMIRYGLRPAMSFNWWLRTLTNGPVYITLNSLSELHWRFNLISNKYNVISVNEFITILKKQSLQHTENVSGG